MNSSISRSVGSVSGASTWTPAYWSRSSWIRGELLRRELDLQAHGVLGGSLHGGLHVCDRAYWKSERSLRVGASVRFMLAPSEPEAALTGDSMGDGGRGGRRPGGGSGEHHRGLRFADQLPHAARGGPAPGGRERDEHGGAGPRRRQRRGRIPKGAPGAAHQNRSAIRGRGRRRDRGGRSPPVAAIVDLREGDPVPRPGR